MKSGGLRKTTSPHGAQLFGRMWTMPFSRALRGGSFFPCWNAKGMKSAWGASIPFYVRPEKSALFDSKRWASGIRPKPSRRASCMVSTIITQSGSSGMSSVSLPQELIDAINNVGFWDSIPLWAVTLIGGLLITVLSFTMILTVYGRMFSLWMYAAIAPIPLSTFAGEPTSSVGKNFIRSYAGVCLQGVVIALSCIIFSAISSSPPAVDTGASVVTAVWTYVGELAFNLLVLVGAIKGCDRIVKEIMGL